MPFILPNCGDSNDTTPLRSAEFLGSELRDIDWALRGLAYVEEGSDPSTWQCADLIRDERTNTAVLMDIRHHLQEMKRPLEAVRSILECPNAQEIPNLLREIRDALNLLRIRLPEPKAPRRRKPARRRPARTRTRR